MNAGSGPGAAGFAWRVDRLDAIDSTSEEARRRALAGDPGHLWIVAEEQSAGRGRRGRTWVSPRGNLYASALLIDPCPPAIAAQLGFVAGVALVRAAEDLGAAARLKWPNDLVSGRAKCAGLLVEGVSLPRNRLACIVGVGVNCESAPEGAGYPTARLIDVEGRPADRGALFQRLAVRFDEALGQWKAGAAFEAIRALWLGHAAALGERIRIENAGGRREGTFEGLDPDGRLLFRGKSGIETVEAADLWIFPQSDGSLAAASSVSRAREGRT
ncbi:MAG: biotin--[acetyl-CoA-carboxylase] ligase [Hyphomicrobiales bacterium]|nr:biotin--[acetyl-CoA-carboxylase] ligase [Hyphomicrobiales bacterium]MBV8442623.1 biotin--[acetyl-CoA-carboxylase] ligase [Hyphomicrobiales bacterium]